jgi:hypothetical protein
VTFKFWELLKNASGVTLVPKKYFFFLKFLNLVQSFVECTVSLADGMHQQSKAVDAYQFDSQILIILLSISWKCALGE